MLIPDLETEFVDLSNGHYAFRGRVVSAEIKSQILWYVGRAARVELAPALAIMTASLQLWGAVALILLMVVLARLAINLRTRYLIRSCPVTDVTPATPDARPKAISKAQVWSGIAVAALFAAEIAAIATLGFWHSDAENLNIRFVTMAVALGLYVSGLKVRAMWLSIQAVAPRSASV